MRVIIPMAGLGSRFTNAGYTTHKPLIQVNNKSLIRYVGSKSFYPLAIRNLLITTSLSVFINLFHEKVNFDARDFIFLIKTGSTLGRELFVLFRRFFILALTTPTARHDGPGGHPRTPSRPSDAGRGHQSHPQGYSRSPRTTIPKWRP
mgnify:CR=1 FL=1